MNRVVAFYYIVGRTVSTVVTFSSIKQNIVNSLWCHNYAENSIVILLSQSVAHNNLPTQNDSRFVGTLRTVALPPSCTIAVVHFVKIHHHLYSVCGGLSACKLQSSPPLFLYSYLLAVAHVYSFSHCLLSVFPHGTRQKEISRTDGAEW